MTRPLFEPSLQRTDRKLGFSADQLFRRPAPETGSNDVPWARVSRGFDASNQAATSGSVVTMVPNHTYNMGTGESGEAYFVANGNGIQMVQQCKVLIRVGMYWVEASNFVWAIGYSNLGASGQYWNYYPAQNTHTHWYETTFDARLEINSTVTMVFTQLSGSGKNLDAGIIDVEFMGTYTGDQWDDMDPQQ